MQLPDKQRQTVDYSVHGNEGYKADVTYSHSENSGAAHGDVNSGMPLTTTYTSLRTQYNTAPPPQVVSLHQPPPFIVGQ